MNGVYGNKRPAIITSDDIDIYYYYRPNRGSESGSFKDQKWKQLDSTLLTSNKIDISRGERTTEEVIPGIYDLRLPASIFGSVGIYNIYIKPKEIITNIVDVSTLYTNPSIRGIVLSLTTEMGEVPNGDLVGYRVEYFNNGKRSDEFRIITSNNKCEPVAQNLNDGYASGVSYRITAQSNLLFCTVTPSAPMSFNSTDFPFIGKEMQQIALINTKFEPVMIEVEITDKDINSVATMLEGEQVRNLNRGIITTFKDGEIYHQAHYGTITNQNYGLNHDFKITKDTVETSEKNTLRIIEENV